MSENNEGRRSDQLGIVISGLYVRVMKVFSKSDAASRVYIKKSKAKDCVHIQVLLMSPTKPTKSQSPQADDCFYQSRLF